MNEITPDKIRDMTPEQRAAIEKELQAFNKGKPAEVLIPPALGLGNKNGDQSIMHPQSDLALSTPGSGKVIQFPADLEKKQSGAGPVSNFEAKAILTQALGGNFDAVKIPNNKVAELVDEVIDLGEKAA